MKIVKIFLLFLEVTRISSAPAQHHHHSKKASNNEPSRLEDYQSRKLVQDTNLKRPQYPQNNNAFGQPNYPYGMNSPNGVYVNNNPYQYQQTNGQYQMYDQNGFNQVGVAVTPNPMYPNNYGYVATQNSQYGNGNNQIQHGYNQQNPFGYQYQTTQAPFPFNLFQQQPTYTQQPPPFPFNLFVQQTTQAPMFPFNIFQPQTTQAPLAFPFNLFGKK
jgi:hypothetical protein